MVSEIYFNPTAATAAEMAVYNEYAFNNDNFEFIEVLNITPVRSI